jgi:hypothetical protein
MNGCGVKSQTASLGGSLCGQGAPEPLHRYVVDEGAAAVDLDHGEKFAVTRFELGIAADVDLLVLEAELAAHLAHGVPRALAQVAPLRVVEPNPADRYGYRPRVVVASPTRSTASPYAAMRMLTPRDAWVSQVSRKARVTMSFNFAFTSASFQKYSWRP